jgi:pyridoxamine 5'-phosphate oxidase
MADDPFALFDAWFAEAQGAEPSLPEAMSVATVGADGRPSSRMVLLKDFGPEGFTFYTNADSRKGEELAAHPHAALLFHWKSLHKQVRIEGPVTIVAAGQSDNYFASRSRDSQIGAHASAQSRPLGSREELERQCAEVERRFDGAPVPRPENWIGYRVTADRIEFWSELPSRLHERRLFERSIDGWAEGLLYP